MTAFLIVAATVAAFTAVCVWADTDDDTHEWWA